MNVLYHHRTRASEAEGIHIQGIQNALRELGFHICDMSLFRRNSEVEEPQEKGQHNNIQTRILNVVASLLPNILFKFLEIVYNCRAFFVGWRILSCGIANNNLPEFIYERYAYFGFAMTFLAQKYQRPLVLEVNTTCLDYDVRKIRLRWLARRIERYVFQGATLLVVVSKYLQEKIQREYSIPSERIIVSPNAVDPQQFSNLEQNEPDPRLVHARDFVQGKLVIGFVGIFVPWHGLEFLIDVYNNLVRTSQVCSSLSLILVGDGPMRLVIEEKIHAAALSEKVLITGRVPHRQVKYFINLLDVAIMPDSNPFGSPMKIIEYMAMGKPVVAPDYGPVTEVLTHGETGLIFKPRDKDDCLKAIELLLGDSDLRNRLGKNAKHVVLTERTWRINVEKILQKLKQCQKGFRRKD